MSFTGISKTNYIVSQGSYGNPQDIRNKYIDSSLDKLDKMNFSFVDFTIDEAIGYLSSKYNVTFTVETIGKKKIYNVEPKKKWKSYLLF